MPHAGQAFVLWKHREIDLRIKWFGHGSPPSTASGSWPVARGYWSWLVTRSANLHPTEQRRPALVVRPSPPRLRTRYASETRLTATDWLLPALPLVCAWRSTFRDSIGHHCMNAWTSTGLHLATLPLYPSGGRQCHQFRGIFPPVDRAGP